MSTPSDPGLQPERTLLAWRRTCLALALGSIVAMRLTAPESGAPAVALGAAGALLSAGAYAAATVRYRRTHRDLTASSPLTADGMPLALLAAAVGLLGVASALYLVGHAGAG